MQQRIIMINKLIFAISFFSLFILNGCTQRDRDAISDLTYALTGVPGAKHKQALQNQEQGVPSKARLERLKQIEEFKARRSYWVGKSVDDLVMSWGSPSNTHKRTDGGTQYTWKWTQNNGWGQSTICTNNFVANKKGTITDWNYSGCWEHL
ncbi:hypothetical protein GWI76_04660 [Proteus sp. G2659]|nr:hypothetical protein PROPEN_04530 [Proteus penneri ATCC 35198]NBM78557.1 hypothetical protein [Proteus sp. G2659]